MEYAKPSNYQIKSFHESSKVEEEACKFVIPYFTNLYWDWFVDVRKDEKYWWEDIDFFVNWSSMELKANNKIIVNFLFELKEEIKGQRKDWNFLYSQAEYWLITDNEKKVGWLFKLKELRIAVLNIIKNQELKDNVWKVYRFQDSGNDRFFINVSINRDYLLGKLEFVKRIDFGNNFSF